MSNTNIIPQNIMMLNNEELAHHNTASSLDYKDWDTNDVQAWIEEHLKMPQYKEVFSNLCIDGSLLDHITDVDLQNDFSIQVRLHRVKIIQGIQKLQKQAQSITEQQQIQYQQQQQLQISSNSNNHNINYQQNSQQMQLICFNKHISKRKGNTKDFYVLLQIISIDSQLYIQMQQQQQLQNNQQVNSYQQPNTNFYNQNQQQQQQQQLNINANFNNNPMAAQNIQIQQQQPVPQFIQQQPMNQGISNNNFNNNVGVQNQNQQQQFVNQIQQVQSNFQNMQIQQSVIQNPIVQQQQQQQQINLLPGMIQFKVILIIQGNIQKIYISE